MHAENVHSKQASKQDLFIEHFKFPKNWDTKCCTVKQYIYKKPYITIEENNKINLT